MRKQALFVFGFAVFGSGALAADVAPPAWSERGVFVFDGVVLDFWKDVEVFGPTVVRPVNCSTPDFYCVRGNIVNLVLPRECRDIKVGDEWSIGENRTTVLDEEPVPDPSFGLHPRGSTRVFFLGGLRRPHVVYRYDRAQGVNAILYDPAINFVDIARTNQIWQYEQQAKLQRQPYFFALISLDFFGRCSEPWESPPAP
jgi:hypothetical protein